MVLLRRVIGDALRARRQGQHRTLREVSSAANVSLGYLSEIERGHKEPSSELLAAICDALGARLSELLREVSDTVELSEGLPGVLVPRQERTARPHSASVAGRDRKAGQVRPGGASALPAITDQGVHTAEPGVRTTTDPGMRQVATDGKVTVSVRQESPLKTTLRTTRRVRTTDRDRDIVCAA